MINTFDSANFDLTERDLPIEKKWVIAPMVSSFFVLLYTCLVLLAGILLGEIMLALIAIVISVIVLVYLAVGIAVRVLERRNFHFSLTPQGIRTNQGIIAKTERNVNYNVIQNVLVTQDMSGVLFGLADVHIENATSAGIQMSARQPLSSGILIAGLSEAHAFYLRVVILENVKLHLGQGLGQGL